MNSPLKLKIELKNLPHKCTRTVLVPENINMRQLHFIIQDAVGWHNSHLFEFTDAKVRRTISIGMPDEFEMEWIGPPKKDAHKVNLKNIFLKKNGGKAFWYWYDFGDDWWHRISFLKFTQKDRARFDGFPVCVKAEGKCPPEDVGGPWGYAEFLEIIKDKKHLEYKESRIWCGMEKGETYNENEVNLPKINYMLNEFYDSEEWKSKSYDL
ncbi:MAG: plasmid pRiA4b ORF-3 family protein [Bacteroidota bacterium]